MSDERCDEAVPIRNPVECVQTGPGTIFENWAANRMAAAERQLLEAVAVERERCARIIEDDPFVYREVRGCGSVVDEGETRTGLSAKIREVPSGS